MGVILNAMVYVVVHASGAIKEVATSCDTVLIEVLGKDVDDLVYHVDKKIFENFGVFTRLHPIFLILKNLRGLEVTLPFYYIRVLLNTIKKSV
ncbi:hypothetical protein AB835_09915 [Candidatus Endobugula sertula]|uniref:Uncharacterized protein n=1 Tax=Candidatus Endobugula sertula TaxID=62101 RepID=A0A1D2QNU4_9GAMM|nr:hypothetical protein AB835_09915 [Candidatus Endobugula sertula]